MRVTDREGDAMQGDAALFAVLDAVAIEDCIRAVETAVGTGGWKLPKL